MPDSPSPIEYHVLLALADGPLYGYAIKGRVEEDSDGALAPRAGSLYRIIARLMSAGWVEEAEVTEREDHPGRDRKYYGLTPTGRVVVQDETDRLREVARLAARRLEKA